MTISRQIQQSIQNDFFKEKVILLLGARQVGKTTLIKEITKALNRKFIWFDGEEYDTRILFENSNVQRLKQIVGKAEVVLIDEAQKIHNIGSALKIFADYFNQVQVIATGSSSFELRNELNEPLTGRKFEYRLFPIAFKEMVDTTSLWEEVQNLEQRLVYGYYPEVITTSEPERILRELSTSYLYKDILAFSGIKKTDKLFDLLRLLAWQIGNEVNYHEIGNILKIDNQTVEHYIHLLEQSFVVYRLNSYHTNQRNELKKSKKIYFVDLGVRNSLINDFRPIPIRNDVGALFENFMVNEILKQNIYQKVFANLYFWRYSRGKEVDLVLEKNGKLIALEFKWNAQKNTSMPRSFANLYPKSEFVLLNRNNFYDFLLSDLNSLFEYQI